MKTCRICNKPIKSQYDLCYTCYQERQRRDEYLRYRDMSEDEKEAEREAYYNTECDMCGKEGASPRSDGRNYCGTCWTIWNS